ncbi:hypothetical protein GE09DRAFT_952849 [Coniochaeta sp. 2T2.1]|nr:hypothetical protein GE09DRAFT_952849 [Coniochaeta sp. 2T2.1]
MSKVLYDCLIIGGGPAGLAAATSLARLQHKCLVFDSGVYRNALSKHMHNVIGWDHRDPADLRSQARQDLDNRYKGIVSFQNATIREIRKLESGRFEAVDESGNVHSGKKIVLATGVRDILPDIPGYAECWTKGIFHCLFCFGYEDRGKKSAGVLAIPLLTETFFITHVGNNALQLAEKITIYTNGDGAMTAKLREALVKPDPRITLETRKIARLDMKSSDASDVIVTFEDGTTTTEGLIAHPPLVEINGPFVDQLSLELNPTGEIKVTPPFNQTSVEGVFACGDAATMTRAVAQAAVMGAMAAVGAAAQVEAEGPH